MKELILYATAGIGHKKAAIAVKEAFDQKGMKDVVMEDVLNYTSPFFRASYCSIYIFLVKYLPTIWGFFYYVLDNPFIYALVRPIRRFTNKVNSYKFVKFLLDNKPETVIVTHFMPLEIIAVLKRKGILNTRLVAVITDYKSHTFWLSQHVDLYIVPSDYTKEDFIKRGIREDKIKALGIPCELGFSKQHDTNAIKDKFGLDKNKKTVFILGGGFGVGPIKKIAANLDKAEEDFQVMVVCGYNKVLFESINNIAKTARHPFRVFGFVDNVDELMAVSSVLISKSGGITTTEALSSTLPMIVVDPIPGQEMRNYIFLEKSEAAVKLKRAEDISGIIRMLFSTGKLETLKENIRKIRYENSAKNIVEEVCG